MSSSTNMKSVIAATLKNLESQVAALRAALNEMPTEASPPVQPKEKRVMSAGVAAWNENVKSVLAQMVAADWKHPVSGKSAIYRDALAEAGRLRGLADPEVAKKQAEQKVKKAEKKAAKAASSSASSVASAPSVTAPVPAEKKERKNPWLDLTEEQKAERVAKMAAGKLAKKEAAAAPVSVTVPSASNPFDDAVVTATATEAPASDAESATSSKKRGPPKGVKLSEEERVRRAAKAKATRDAKKVASAAAVPLPASPPSSSASSVIVDEIDEETFTKQQIGSKIIYKNALGHVRAYTTEGAGIWLGMYDPVKKVIDTSVPEPSE